MASVYIVPRKTQRKGTRYSVRCEIHNRPIIRLGTFSDEKHAWSRKIAALDVISKHPNDHAAYDALTSETPIQTAQTVRDASEAWLATREQDAADSTLKGFRQIVRDIPAWLEALDITSVTHVHAQQYVTELAARYKRGTIARTTGVLRMIFDYHGVKPNPIADARVKLPRGQSRAFRLPTRAQLDRLAIVLPARRALMEFLEHTGLRIEEAAALRWSDFDWPRGRFLVRKSKTNAGKRWVDHLDGTPAWPQKPAEAGPNDLVFAKPSASTLTSSLRWAHLKRGAFLMSSHDFRHLHASRLLHEQALSPAQIAARLGHTNTSVLHDVYVHVVPPDD
jgi:integrase